MKEKMKQNKKYVAIFCVVLMLCSFVSFSSFAYTDNSSNGVNFDLQPYTQADYGSQSNALIWGYNSGSTEQKVYFTTDNPIYIFTYKIDSTNIRLAAISETSVSSAGWSRTSVNGYAGFSVESYNSTYNLYSANPLGYWYAVNESASDIPLFASFDDGIAAVRDWIDNPPPVAPPAHVANFTLPAGNAVVIDLGAWDNNASDKKIQLSQTTQYAHPQNWSTNQFYAYTSELPNSISTPFPGQNPINWVGYGKTTLFNQVFSFNCNLIYASSLGRYLVIINPFVPEDHDTDNYNAPISVYVGQCSGYKFYQLKTDVTQTGAFGGEGDGTTGTGTYDPDSGTWSVTNDQTGEIWAPSQGGGNSNNAVLTVSGWLEQISHQIADFFTGAIGAVSNLINAGSAFFNVLVGLYTWLPPAVLSVLSSALIVVITIGVIKVFI